jgi:hypothetical protein
VKGISNIILKKLKSLDVTQRPVHCSDAKREILYVKDNNVWEKEDSENNKLKNTLELIKLMHETLTDVIQFLDEKKYSNTKIREKVDMILTNGHAWANDHITTSADDIEEVYHFMKNTMADMDHSSHGEEMQVSPMNIEILGNNDEVEIEKEEGDEDEDE